MINLAAAPISTGEWIGFAVIMTLLIVGSIYNIISANKVVKARREISDRALVTINKEELRNLIVDWAKTKGWDITPEQVAIWRSQREFFGVKIFTPEDRQALRELSDD